MATADDVSRTILAAGPQMHIKLKNGSFGFA